jgi:hypothetical protein
MTKSIGWFSKRVIISTVIAGILIDFILKTGIISYLFNFLSGLLFGFYCFMIKPKVIANWLLIFLILGWLIVIFWFIRRAYSEYKTVPPPPPAYIDYNEDVFDGVLYRWEYYYAYGVYRNTDPVAYCPRCFCKLYNSTCPEDKIYFETLRSGELDSLIEHRIEIKYPKH